MDSGCGSAMKDFFNSINTFVRHEETSSTINEKGQLQMSQLKFLKLAIDDQPDGYGGKLIEIMTNGLKETLGPLYEVAIRSGLPKSFLPVIGINNDNTPFVEFIVKSDKADDAPFTAEYTLEHLELAQSITDNLIRKARNERLMSSTPYKSRRLNSTDNQQLTSYQDHSKKPNNIEALFRNVKQRQEKELHKLRSQQQPKQPSFAASPNTNSFSKVSKENEPEDDPILQVTSHNQTVGRTHFRRINPVRSCKSLDISYRD